MGAAEDQASPNPGHSIAGECPTLADCTLGGCCQRVAEDFSKECLSMKLGGCRNNS